MGSQQGVQGRLCTLFQRRTPHNKKLPIRHVMESSPLHAVTATVRSVAKRNEPTGSKAGKQNCYLSNISTSFHHSRRTGPHRLLQQGGRLHHSLQSRFRDTAHHRARPQTPRRRDRLLRHPSHLGTEPAPSSSPALRRSRRRLQSRLRPLDRLPARLLPARARSLKHVPPAVPRSDGGRLLPGKTPVPGGNRSASGRTRFRQLPCCAGEPRMGGLCQTALRRSFAGAGISRPLHSSSRAPNERLLNVSDCNVTFQWKDYRHKDKQKSRAMTVPAEEFIRRFLIHTLPPGFPRIRHLGFLANRHRREKLALSRQLLTTAATELLPGAERCRELAEALHPPPPSRCSCCGGIMIRLGFVPAYLWPVRPSGTS